MFPSIPQFVPQEVCLKCDGCCRFKDGQTIWRPKMVMSERKQLEHGQKSLVQFIFPSEYFEKDEYLKTVSSHGQCECVFFDRLKNACKIYPLRPFECQLYPFVLGTQNGKIVVYVHLNCPHVQEHQSGGELAQFVDQLRNFFQNAEVLEFIRNNQSLARDYSVYADELIYLFSVDI